MGFEFSSWGFEFFASDFYLGEVAVAESAFGVGEVSDFGGVEAHEVGGDGVCGDEVGACEGDAHLYGGAAYGAVSFHAGPAVDDGEVWWYLFDDFVHVEVHCGVALVEELFVVLGAADDDVFEGEGDDEAVVGFWDGEGDSVVGVCDCFGDVDGDLFEVVVVDCYWYGVVFVEVEEFDAVVFG